jgi:hypothetical protein
MSGQASKERFQKRLRIGVRFNGTSFVLLDGKPLPKLTEGTFAELVIAPESIEDAIVRDKLEGLRSIPFLAEGSFILFGVSPTMIDDKKADGLVRPDHPRIISEYLFVEVKLGADLWLQLRGDQEAGLSPCLCTITALNRPAESLNHAFTLISEAYETRRRSHSGNVFERGYVMSKSGWQNLAELRLETIAKSLPSAGGDAQQPN